ncbi:hypothetical protein HY641_05235 [Candidatus Woesearchaeota archaeon]|nr:hypothetical protein [Candidatus Woesearchaeota archaeon]
MIFAYQSPLDRQYYSGQVSGDAPTLETPIVPIKDLGMTIPETNPATGANIVQNVEAAVRSGASQIQIVMTTSSQAAIGGRPKAYGKDVREGIKEKLKANQVNLVGVEMPTSSITNMTGFDGQQFNRQKLQDDMQEVRDAMTFVADVAQGGGVDIVSFEFPRTIFDQEWAKDNRGNKLFEAYENEEKTARKYIVDTRDGRINQVPIDQKVPVVKKDKIGPDGLPIVEEEDFNYFKAEAARIGGGVKAEELYFRARTEGAKRQAEAYTAYYGAQRDRAQQQLDFANAQAEEFRAQNPQARQLPKEIQERIDLHTKEVTSNRELILSQRQQVLQYEEIEKASVSTDKYALDRAKKSYAELGIHAMNETKHNPNVSKDKPLYVGPELGWPGTFGGHPDEFIQLVKGAREEMVKLLTQPKIQDEQGNIIENPYAPSFSGGVREAEEMAKKHIKGLFDTSHLGMWLNHYRRIAGESDETRLANFKVWYMDQVKALAESDAVGAIQAVDSASGAHGHLPAGQGILPVVDAVKLFKEKNFQGFIVSEGHEEEKFGQNRILLKTWEAFGSPIGGAYPGLGVGAPFPGRWRDVQNSYLGRLYNPNFIVGAYAPSNDWKLWSEVPLE